MSLHEHFKRSGATLFRWRGYPPLLLALLLLAAAFIPARVELRDPALHRAWDAICVAVAVAGLALRVLVVGQAPDGTSGRNRTSQVAAALNQHGMYSVVRHPLYLANLLLWLGPVLVLRSPWATLVMLLGFWLYYESIMYDEEHFMEAKFGQEWHAWAARTPAFLPRWSQWRRSDQPFSWRRVLRREYSGVLALGAGFAFAFWVESLRGGGSAL